MNTKLIEIIWGVKQRRWEYWAIYNSRKLLPLLGKFGTNIAALQYSRSLYSHQNMRIWEPKATHYCRCYHGCHTAKTSGMTPGTALLDKEPGSCTHFSLLLPLLEILSETKMKNKTKHFSSLPLTFQSFTSIIHW